MADIERRRGETFVVDADYVKKQAKDAVSELFAPVVGAVTAFEKATRPKTDGRFGSTPSENSSPGK